MATGNDKCQREQPRKKRGKAIVGQVVSVLLTGPFSDSQFVHFEGEDCTYY